MAFWTTVQYTPFSFEIFAVEFQARKAAGFLCCELTFTSAQSFKSNGKIPNEQKSDSNKKIFTE